MSTPALVHSSPLRVGLVGCGDISPMHLDAIRANPDVVLVGVADTDTQARAGAASNDSVPGFADLTALLDAEHPDVVHICTPHHLHAAMAVECLDRGIHVLMEKPVGITVADGEAVVRAAEASRATIGVCYQNRYNATVRAIRELLDAGTMGELYGGRATVSWFRDEAYYAHRPWRGRWSEAGGGVLINQAIHTLDLLQWFLGEVTTVRGQAARLRFSEGIEVEDTAVIQLGHEGGARSLFHASNGYVTNAPISLELVAERGIITLDTDLRIEHSDGRVDIIEESRAGQGERAYWGASHGDLIDDFYSSVRTGTPFWIGPTEALKSLRVLTAVYEQSPGLR